MKKLTVMLMMAGLVAATGAATLVRLAHLQDGQAASDQEQSGITEIDGHMRATVRLPFIENHGQTNQDVRFYAKTFAGTVFVTADSLTYVFNGASQATSAKGVAVKERFLPQQVLRPTGLDKTETVVNYFVGEKERWRSNIPAYDAVGLGNVWPSVAVELSAYGDNVEKLFKVQPGGSVEDIRLAFEGVKSLLIDEEGKLLLETELGTIAMTKPVAYQDIKGLRKSVEVSYFVDGSTYGFAASDYDPRYALVIDPLLASTFIGGSSDEDARAIALDSVGNVFVASRTSSTNYPTIAGAFDTSFNLVFDVVITKFKNDLTGPLLASTFIGGSNSEEVRAIALDSDGNVFVTGRTSSTNYPTTPGAFDTTFNVSGLSDVFITKLKNDLTGPLLASTFIGGFDSDEAFAIALDSVGNVFVTGETFLSSSIGGNYPTTPGAFDTLHNDSLDVFVTKIKNDLTGPLLASTFIGGGGAEGARGITVEAISGDVFVTGFTSSTDFPTTLGAFDTTFGGSSDVFVTKLKNDLTGPLLASTFIGGSNRDTAFAIALFGDVFVTGETVSSDYPTTPGAFDGTYNLGSTDVFVSKLLNDLSALQASTFIGGSDRETAFAIALDEVFGDVFVTGGTLSSDYPTTPGAFDTSSSTGGDAFITKLKNDLSAPLLASTFIGGGGVEFIEAITIEDISGDVFVAGGTTPSRNFEPDYPVTAGAFDTTHNSGFDVFVSRITSDLSADTIPDTTPPETTITSAVDGNGASIAGGGSTLSTSITFTFEGTDAVGVDRLECSLDSSGFTTCVSPRSLGSLAATGHMFEVRAVDLASNTDPSPATFVWTVFTSVEASQNLITEIEGLGLPGGTKNALLGPLRQIERILTDTNPQNDTAVCGKLDDFLVTVNEKEAVGGLTAGQATQLRQAAQAIKVNQGCP